MLEERTFIFVVTLAVGAARFGAAQGRVRVQECGDAMLLPLLCASAFRSVGNAAWRKLIIVQTTVFFVIEAEPILVLKWYLDRINIRSVQQCRFLLRLARMVDWFRDFFLWGFLFTL